MRVLLPILMILTCAVLAAQDVARKITFNGRELTERQLVMVQALEQAYGVHLPDGGYWYDNRTGAVGSWNGPAFGLIPAGLGLGGAMPANCSGGLSRVFINGRALHPLDIAAIAQITPVVPGRYWMDAQGYIGYEGGPALGNLIALANSRSSGGRGQRRVYSDSDLGVIINPAGACASAGCFYK